MEKSSQQIASDWRVAFFNVLAQLGATPHKGATDLELSEHFSLPLRAAHARRFELLRMGIIQSSGLCRPTPWDPEATVWALVDAIHIPEMEPPKDETHCDRDFRAEHIIPRNRAGHFCANSHTIFHPSPETIARGTQRCWNNCGGKVVGFYCFHHPMYGPTWALDEHPKG